MRAIMYNLFAYLDQFSYEKYYEKVASSYRKGKMIFLTVVFSFVIILIFVMSFAERNEIVERNMLLSSAAQGTQTHVATSFNDLYGATDNTLQLNIPVDNSRSKNITYFETAQLVTAHSIIFRNTNSLVYNKSAGKLFLIVKNIGDKSTNNLGKLMYQSSSPAIPDINIYKYHIRC